MLVDMLRCPLCGSQLKFSTKENEFICLIDMLGYKKTNNIINFKQNDARRLTKEEVENDNYISSNN